MGVCITKSCRLCRRHNRSSRRRHWNRPSLLQGSCAYHCIIQEWMKFSRVICPLNIYDSTLNKKDLALTSRSIPTTDSFLIMLDRTKPVGVGGEGHGYGPDGLTIPTSLFPTGQTRHSQGCGAGGHRGGYGPDGMTITPLSTPSPRPNQAGVKGPGSDGLTIPLQDRVIWT